MKIFAKFLKWLSKKLRKKKSIEVKIQSTNSQITVVFHKD